MKVVSFAGHARRFFAISAFPIKLLDPIVQETMLHALIHMIRRGRHHANRRDVEIRRRDSSSSFELVLIGRIGFGAVDGKVVG